MLPYLKFWHRKKEDAERLRSCINWTHPRVWPVQENSFMKGISYTEERVQESSIKPQGEVIWYTMVRCFPENAIQKMATEDMHLNTPLSKHPPSIHFFLDDRWAIPKDGFIP